MSTDNPFDPGDHGSDIPRPTSGTREAVPLDLGAVVTRAWELITENPGAVLGAAFIPVVLGFVLGFPLGLVEAGFDIYVQESGEVPPAVELVVSLGFLALRLVVQIITFFLALGVIRIYVNLAFGRLVELRMLVGEGRHLIWGLIASFLIGIGTVFGILLLVVPGIIVALGTQFALYAMVDQEMGPLEAIQESWRLTDGYKGTLFVFGIVFFVVAVVVTCATCGVGYLLALPILQLIQAVLYHSLMDLKSEG